MADKKANPKKGEYQKYQVQTLSPVEEAYLQTMKDVEKTARKKGF